MNKSIPSILIILILCCCSSKEFDNEEELWTYIKNTENGYFQEKTVKGVHFSLMYKPTDLLVAQEIGKKDSTPKEIDSLRNKYSQYAYFNLSLSRGNKELLNSVAGDRNKFGTLVNQLSFKMDEKIHLHTDKLDTISLLDYSYPRMYGLSNKTSILLVYSMQEIKNSSFAYLSIEDLGFKTGDIRFSLPNLNNSAKLKFK